MPLENVMIPFMLADCLKNFLYLSLHESTMRRMAAQKESSSYVSLLCCCMAHCQEHFSAGIPMSWPCATITGARPPKQK